MLAHAWARLMDPWSLKELIEVGRSEWTTNLLKLWRRHPRFLRLWVWTEHETWCEVEHLGRCWEDKIQDFWVRQERWRRPCYLSVQTSKWIFGGLQKFIFTHHHAQVKTLKSRQVEFRCSWYQYIWSKIPPVSLTKVSKKTKEHKNAMINEVRSVGLSFFWIAWLHCHSFKWT